VGWGKILGGFCLYLYVISFDFDSGVGMPVTLTFWPGGVNTLETPPAPMRDLNSIRFNIENFQHLSLQNIYKFPETSHRNDDTATNSRTVSPSDGHFSKKRTYLFWIEMKNKQKSIDSRKIYNSAKIPSTKWHNLKLVILSPGQVGTIRIFPTYILIL